MATKLDEHFDIGVIIARFQVPDLHEGHKRLLGKVLYDCDKVIVFLGTTVVLDSIKDPLDFATRKMMVDCFIKRDYSNAPVIVLPLADMPGKDVLWSKQIDRKIREVFPLGSVRLYASRDSFIPHYKGVHTIVEVEETKSVNGTTLREDAARRPISSEAFRAGVIYAKMNQWPKFHPTVDLAIYRKQGKDVELLLGKKPGETLWRLVGGFMDPGKDTSAEEAVMRECDEETGGNITTTCPEYICSSAIIDGRYNDGRNKIMTTFFAAEFKAGIPVASDDLEQVGWISLTAIKKNIEIINESHRGLIEKLIEKKWPQK